MKRPLQGEIIRLKEDEPVQIIAIAVNTQTEEEMVVYQTLYGEFRTFVKPLELFLKEPETLVSEKTQSKEPEIISSDDMPSVDDKDFGQEGTEHVPVTVQEEVQGKISQLLLDFLDASSYNRKLEIVTANLKYMNDRMINDMAASLDCTIEEGPMDERIGGLITCLKAMCRFENRRLR